MTGLVLGQYFFKMDLNVRVFILESDEGNIELSVSTESQCLEFEVSD